MHRVPAPANPRARIATDRHHQFLTGGGARTSKAVYTWILVIDTITVHVMMSLLQPLGVRSNNTADHRHTHKRGSEDELKVCG